VKTIKIAFLTFLLIFCLFPVGIKPADVQCEAVNFKVTRVVWGENIDNPIKAYPGDKEVPLTVEVQNLSPNKTIKGVSAILLLDDSPFTDIYGNPNASATGKPSVSEILKPTDEIKPKGFFTLTFTLNIDKNAVPGTYIQTMEIRYSVESDEKFVEGTPQRLEVKIVVSKNESTVSVSVSPQVVEEGESVRVSGSISPAPENATVNLRYIGPGCEFNSTIKVNIDGTFSESFKPWTNGTWNVNASWAGDVRYEGSWASASFEVRPRASLSILTSSNRILGGVDNKFAIKIINDGKVPLSALDVSLDVPNPLVVHGRNSWKISYLDVGEESNITFVIYAPDSSIGSTYSGSFSVNYRDDYGESHTDTFPLGLVVVGRVELISYDKVVRPQPALNGSKVEFTGTLLNKGTVSAMYVNASILPNPILRLTSESATYIGEIEENSQSPFTLGAYIKENVGNGTYPVIVHVTYRDDQHNEHAFNITFHVRVLAVKPKQSSTSESTNFLASYSEHIFTLVTVAVASVTVLLLYRRHLSRRKEIEQSGGSG